MTGGEVEHNEAGAAFIRGVNNIGNVSARTEVEADVVHVAVGKVDSRWEGIGCVDAVVGQGDTNYFWAARLGVRHSLGHAARRGHAVDCWATGVNNPVVELADNLGRFNTCLPKGFGTRGGVGGYVESLS